MFFFSFFCEKKSWKNDICFHEGFWVFPFQLFSKSARRERRKKRVPVRRGEREGPETRVTESEGDTRDAATAAIAHLIRAELNRGRKVVIVIFVHAFLVVSRAGVGRVITTRSADAE